MKTKIIILLIISVLFTGCGGSSTGPPKGTDSFLEMQGDEMSLDTSYISDSTYEDYFVDNDEGLLASDILFDFFGDGVECFSDCSDENFVGDTYDAVCGNCAIGKCDGLIWTPPEMCIDGICQPDQFQNCDDKNPCTDDACDPKIGCSYKFLSDVTICIPGFCTNLLWNKPITCVAGKCEGGGGSQECIDGNNCTEDLCSPVTGCSFLANSNPCDDNDPCTTEDICFGGQCLGTGTLVCEDNNSCTVDYCEKNVGCKHNPANNGKICVPGACKGLDWTKPSTCTSGQCTPQGGQSCDDQISCTTDSCDPTNGCKNMVQTGKCLINGMCYGEGQTNPANACQVCSTAMSKTEWVAKSCDDGKICTTDVCDSSTGCSNDLKPGYCMISNQCFVEGQSNPINTCQVCNTTSSKSVWTTLIDGATCQIASCSGLTYTSTKFCFAGQCTVGGAIQSCDDGKTCTTDACTQNGCTSTLKQGYCLIGGTCYSNGQLNPLNACQSCYSAESTTGWSNVTDDTICVTGSCSGLTWIKPKTCVTGQCTGGGGSQSCNDGKTCTTDACITTGCKNTITSGYCMIDGTCYANGQVNPSNPCQFCTTSKSTTAWSNGIDGVQCQPASCSGLTLSLPKKCASGQCIGSTESCDDALTCTTDSCNATTGCANLLQGGYCLIDGTCYQDGQVNPLKNCQICKTSISTSTWQLKTGTCLINGICYQDGQSNPSIPCQVCNSTKSTVGWSIATDGTKCQSGVCSFQAYTTPKTCVGGQCTGGGVTKSCVNTSCSIANCDDLNGCTHTVQSGYCLINELCYVDGQTNPEEACQICNSSWWQYAWKYIENGTFCSAGYWCQNGHCVCAPQCTGKECGSDSCGGVCGTCTEGKICYNGNCCLQYGKTCTLGNCGSDCCFGYMCSGQNCKCGGLQDGAPCDADSWCQNLKCCSGYCCHI